MIIGVLITGMPGAGKSTLAEAARELGIPVVSMGEVIFKETMKRNLPLTPENTSKVAIELRKKFGEDIVAKLTIELIKSEILSKEEKKEKVLIIVDGIRSLAEVNTFKRFFDKVILVAVHAPPKVRYERVLSRKRLDDPFEVKKLIERDLRELSFGVGSVIAMADEILINKGKTYEEFLTECKTFVKRLLKEAKKNCP